MFVMSLHLLQRICNGKEVRPSLVILFFFGGGSLGTYCQTVNQASDSTHRHCRRVSF